MSMIQAERTPNPNSLKFTSPKGPLFSDEVVAISSSDEEHRHPLGKQLFAIEGVADVFITPEFVTVSKVSSINWSDVQEDVEDALEEHLRGE